MSDEPEFTWNPCVGKWQRNRMSKVQAGVQANVQANVQAAPSPLAREAVKEFYGRCTDATDFFRENIGPVPAVRAAKIVTEESLNVLLDAVSRIEARVRAEVWGKAHDNVDVSGAFSEDAKDLARKLMAEFKLAVRRAALADGVDLTSLAKTE